MKLNRKTLRRMILKEIKSALLIEQEEEEVFDIKGNKILNPSRYSAEELEFLKQNPGVFARASDVFSKDYEAEGYEPDGFGGFVPTQASLDASKAEREEMEKRYNPEDFSLSSYSPEELKKLRQSVKGMGIFSDIYDEDPETIPDLDDLFDD
tara:strand:+ start:309 stop:764 length:456 start_codon:yes stop_codon:yes gene_type:complete